MGEFSSIKKTYINFFLCIITILLLACARPEVVKITSPEDPLMNCDELELSVVEAQKFKRDALYEKDNTGGNVARMMLFWPAMATTYHNADVAIKAANDRTYHLLHLMKKKDCKGVDLVNAELIRTATETIVGQLQAAKEMYESGHLTKEEYTKAKKKILD
tara:strand:- start:296 stop:778 length:483 start_codon:yes stop_codon:yes gene_type:complete